MKKQTAALFAGEPTGGKPNHYGEVQSFKLPSSGLTVTYSVKYFKVLEGDPDSLQPDILVPFNFADYRAKRDPVLEKVLAFTSSNSPRKTTRQGVCLCQAPGGGSK
jgi:hypothetical protein